MSPASIFIAIACHNRKRVAELCLPTMRDCMHADDWLMLHNDGSSEYDHEWLSQFVGSHGTCVPWKTPIGIQDQRRVHLHEFMGMESATHLYLTDHDCIHDLAWRSNALRLQDKYGHRPLCLYNTLAHSDIPGNTMTDDPHDEVIIRRFAPGVSYLLTREHVERLRLQIDMLEHFDWQIPQLIGPFAISRVGYIDHIGWGGQRHPEHEGPDGGDRVTSPTPFLVAKRAEIVAKLKSECTPTS